MNTVPLKRISKRKKTILFLFIIFAVAAGTTIFFISSQASDNSTTYVMYSPGTQTGALNKSQAQTVELQSRLQQHINTLDDFDSSAVKIAALDVSVLTPKRIPYIM